jgi:uncharacterized circularly permuted ATP-grasp superfamily protein/uncharacterized alpha-E superfamily protein
LFNETPPPNASQFYDTRLGSYNDVLSNYNKMPPHWRNFMNTLDTIGGTELENRHREIQRLLSENGVTYTVYNDSGQTNRPWKLDPIPVLVTSEEWHHIDKGLKQRAACLNLILQDLYGEQKLLKKGLLPKELIFAHHGFLAPCVGSLPPSSGLTVYAANLARGPNGGLWVINDHSQAPSGIGYALENRSVVGRVMADMFNQANVMRLGKFISILQKGLAQSAPHNQSDPHIVVLTPGSFNETYFEHAYLASQLGFTLAQGEDLTVRDGKVWLRTLEGLRSVDVILRRVDDRFCDPLELMGRSQLGVAGLLQAVRLGNVSVANPLGSAILENPGILAFLPALCRYFLNEDLVLPSVATWWCGQKKERNFVLSNLDKLAIKSINRESNHRVIFGHTLSSQERESLIRQIQLRPWEFVGQEQVTFSTTPTLSNGQIEARNAVLRSFAVVCNDEYHIMPGGLTRVAANKDQFNVSNQIGAISKDTWIIADKQQDKPASTKSRRPLIIPTLSEPLSSRAADNLFWVGRHYERILGTTRLLRTILLKQTNLVNSVEDDNQHCLQTLLRALTHLTASYPGFVEYVIAQPEQQHQELLSLFRDSQRNGTLATNIQAFFQSAFNIRDLWSQDTWRCIDAIQYYWQSQVVSLNHPHPQLTRHLTELSTRLAAFSGLTAESMTRETGWVLLQTGRKLERSLCLIALLRSTVVQKHKPSQLYTILETLLLTTDSFSIYQRRYRSAARLPQLLELLLQDKSHPHSLLFQLHHLNETINKLPGSRSKNRLRPEQRIILQIYTNIQLCEIKELIKNNNSGIYNELDTLLATTTSQLWELAEIIAQTYFNHVKPPQQMSPTWTESSL